MADEHEKLLRQIAVLQEVQVAYNALRTHVTEIDKMLNLADIPSGEAATQYRTGRIRHLIEEVPREVERRCGARIRVLEARLEHIGDVAEGRVC